MASDSYTNQSKCNETKRERPQKIPHPAATATPPLALAEEQIELASNHIRALRIAPKSVTCNR